MKSHNNSIIKSSIPIAIGSQIIKLIPRISFLVLLILLLISLFKNISYPLMWADESMTAMGSERVAKFGYPKAHDGKNTVNDMFCNTPKLAVNEKDDAFIGGANWGQYYIGAIAYMLAENSTDLYAKTGLFRAIFASIGFLALLLFGWLMSSFFKQQSSKYAFLCVFFLAELISISLALHLREVRYYSPTLFFSLLALSVYLLHRFRKPFNSILFTLILGVLLWIVFNMFSPLYFIFIISIGLSEIIMIVLKYIKTRTIKTPIIVSLPVLVSIAISYIGVEPLLGYFKTFEMKKLLDDFYHFNSAIYWWHFSSEMKYFERLELLWLAAAMRVDIFIHLKKIMKENSPLFSISNFLSLLFIVFIFSIPNIDSPIFTRYLIYMQPVLTIIAIFDFSVLLKIYSKNFTNYKNPATFTLTGVFIILFGYTFSQNLPYIKGHLYEMTHQYKGPLDYTIPYIKSQSQRTDTLIIATDYEETSYMYYLNSKVIVGFVGNNLPEDTLFTPHIISYRQSVGSFFPKVFRGFIRKANYNSILFEAKDIPVNNIPELNFDMPQYNHYFKSVIADNEQQATGLLIRTYIK